MTSQADITIKTENLTKIYTDFWGRPSVKALDNLNLEVYRGEVFGIIGPNGSGKTTAMKILLGLLFPTSGKAYVLGKEPTNVQIKYRVGFLPEESYLYHFLNAEETLDFYASIFKIPRPEKKRRIDELLSFLGLNNARKRKIREYSRGMARKVALAQALINEPDVIFLDEPTSGLDPISSKQIKDLILELKEAGKTVFLSSHLLTDVQNICDRVAILHEGKLRTCGKMTDLVTDKKITKVVFKNLSEKELEKLMEMTKLIGHNISVEFAQYSLEDVFLKEIARDTDEQHPGNSKTHN
jgi:ABC-2 type transport system ATP-binding protein